MKRKLITTTALLIGLFAVTLPARADRLGFQFGIAGGNGFFRIGYDSGRHHKRHTFEQHRRTDRHSNGDRHVGHGRYRSSIRVGLGRPFRQSVHHGHRSAVHTCVKTPVYKRLWVEPVYGTVFAGRDASGRPRYRSVMVKPGHYRTVLSHYRCHCGATYR